MSISANSHAKTRKAYRTAADTSWEATTPGLGDPTTNGATPIIIPPATPSQNWLESVGQWIGNVFTNTVSFVKKAVGWFSNTVVTVVVRPAVKVGSWIRTGFSYTVAGARQAGRVVWSAVLWTVWGVLHAAGFLIKVGFALLAAVVSIPIVFYATVRMVMTSDPRFDGSLIAE